MDVSDSFTFLSKATGVLSSTEQEKDPKFWNNWAQQTLTKALSLQTLNQNKAKNLIFFLGDGKSENILCCEQFVVSLVSLCKNAEAPHGLNFEQV